MINQGIVPEYVKETRRYVLVVEKDTLQGYLLKVSLQDTGWTVRLADDPKEALLFCEHDLFDVAIINYNYPCGVSGFVLGERLYAQYKLPSLMITASRYIELRRCLAFTINQDVLFKPYRLSECNLRLQRLLTGAPLLQEHEFCA
ncbi:MAG: two-component system response regulator [Lewinella sp.]